jgi:predicted dehydrogenase
MGAAAASAFVPYFFSPASADDKVVPGFDQTKTDAEKGGWEPYTDRKLRVGIAGYGFCKFGAEFEFQNHPNVEVVAVTDLFPDRCAEFAKRVKCEKTYPSLEEMVKDDSIEAIFCATDAPSHAKHAILCLEHGKHVAHAVPVFYGDVEWADKLLECVKKNRGLKYAMFETSVFHDDLYAMEKIYKAGGFGKIIYSEGEYFHTKEPGAPSYPSYKDWRKNGTPLWYPTHATAYYTCVTFGSFTEVSAMGKPSVVEARQPQNNKYGNAFGTEVGLFRTTEGGMARMIVSFDTSGSSWGGEVGRMRGQFGAYGEQSKFTTSHPEIQEKVAKMNLRKPALPPNMSAGGHGGSHGYLTNDFIESILVDRLPLVNVAVALNTTMAGVVAHQSALKDGELLKIPQFTL